MISNALLSIRMVAADLGRRLHRDERGQDIMEYVILGGFIALAAAAAFLLLPLDVAFGNMATTISNCVQFDTANCP